MIISNKKIKHICIYIYMLLLGIVGFSRMSQYIIFEIFHLPFYLIEIFFVPFVCYAWKEYCIHISGVLRYKYTIFWMLLIIYDILIGIAYTFDVVGIVTMTRSLFYIVFIALIFIKKKTFDIDKMFLLALGAMFGELVYGIRYSSAEIDSINTSCLVLVILIPIIKEQYGIFVGCSLLALMISINSGYRLGIVLLFVSIMLGIVWTIFNQEKIIPKVLIRKLAVPVVSVLGIILIVINYKQLVEFASSLMGTSQYAIFRVTDRLVGLITGDFAMSREAERMDIFKLAFTTFGERMLPRGLVGKSIGNLSYYFDVPITYFYDAFGSILTIPILSVTIFKGVKCFFASFKRNTPKHYVVSGLMFPILLICLIVNGSFLYITFQCITTGILVGEWYAYDKGRRKCQKHQNQ